MKTLFSIEGKIDKIVTDYKRKYGTKPSTDYVWEMCNKDIPEESDTLLGNLETFVNHKKRITIFKVFLKWLRFQGIFIVPDHVMQAKIASGDYSPTKVTLEKEELKNLYEYEFENSSFTKERDAFIFMCMTSFRYSDLLEIYSEDTGELKDIINIKKVILGKETYTKKKKWECISSHTGRRTFITLALENGIPQNKIMKMTSHKRMATLNEYVNPNTKAPEPEKISFI